MTTTQEPTNALATRELTDKQILQRMELNKQAGWGLEKGTPPQLNLVFLLCQKYHLLPGDDVTLYEGRPWITIDGRVKLMRRHPEYRGYSCRPLSKPDKEAWGYDVDDIVVECVVRTSTWGEISARGKVTRDEAEGTQVQGRRMNYVARIHPVEMAEKRAIARAERAAFGADAVIDEDEAEEQAHVIIQERNNPQTVQANAAEYDRVMGTEEDRDTAADPPARRTPDTGESPGEDDDPDYETVLADALTKNVQLLEDARSVDVKGLGPLTAKANWPLHKVNEASQELMARIRSRNGELDQSLASADQAKF